MKYGYILIFLIIHVVNYIKNNNNNNRWVYFYINILCASVVIMDALGV